MEVGLHCNNLWIVCGDLVIGCLLCDYACLALWKVMRKNGKKLLWTATLKGLSSNSFRDKTGCQAVNVENTSFFMLNCFSWPGSQKSKLFGSPLGGKNHALGRQGPLFKKLNSCTRQAFGGTEDTQMSVSQLDCLFDQNFFSSLNATAAVGKKRHSGLPEQLLTEGTQNAEGEGCSLVQWTSVKQIKGALIYLCCKPEFPPVQHSRL